MGQQGSKPAVVAEPIVSQPTANSGRPVDKDGNPLKPCCVCPETKKIRDMCMLRMGDEAACSEEIEAHKQCMRDLGFKI